jgi:hypothetical protein
MKKLIIFAALLSLVFSANAFAQTANADADSSANAVGGGAQAEQGQQQGQTQGIGLDQFNNSFNSRPMRGFAIPNDVNFPAIMNYFGAQPQSVEYQDVANLLTYVNIFSEDTLAAAVSQFGPKASLKDINVFKQPVAKPGKIHGQRWIMVVLTAPKTQIKDSKGSVPFFVGSVSGWANSEEELMDEVMYATALEALRKGCNVLQLTAQGAAKDAISSGWGIGFNSTYSTISGGGGNGGQGIGTVSSGGTGYSKARAGSRDLPWLQGMGLVVSDSELRPAIIARLGEEPKASEDGQTGNHRPAKK